MTDDFMSTARAGGDGIQRGRGGFYRNAMDVPFVSDPSGELVKTGPRAGKPKRIAYGQPSGRGKQIENSYNLQKWNERQVVTGLGIDPTIALMCRELAGMVEGSDEHRQLADKIVVQAKAAAQSNLSADRGSHVHLILQEDDEGRDWRNQVGAGEVLGITAAAQTVLVEGWRGMRVDTGLEILVTEASCVDDEWRLAGTLDNLALTHRPLRFRMASGELVDIPAGTVVVLDKKTGRRTLDRQGAPQYWHSYAIQVASYAASQYYDTEREVRAPWPWPVSQTHALIAHLDVLGAIAGRTEGLCELVYVDLAATMAHGGRIAHEAKAWERRNDLFSVAAVEAAEVVQSVQGDEAAPAPTAPIADGVAAEGLPPLSAADAAAPQPAQEPAPGPAASSMRRDWLRTRCQSLAQHDQAAADLLITRWQALGLPSVTDTAVTNDQLDAIDALLSAAETQCSAPFIGGDPTLDQPGAARADLPEGHDVSPADVAHLALCLTELSSADLARCRAYAAEAAATGAGISLVERASLRRYEIARALYHFCRAGWDDILVTAVLVNLTGLTGPVGQQLGRLTERAAFRLADVAAAHAAGSLIATVQPDGSTAWTDGGQFIYTTPRAA